MAPDTLSGERSPGSPADGYVARAIFWTAPGHAELASVGVPAPAAAEVTVSAALTVVSPGTERAQFLRLPNTSVEFPHTPGYSGAGHILAVGNGTRGVEPGEPVAVVWMRHASAGTHPIRDVFSADGLSLRAAGTVAAGAMMYQGVRRAGVECTDRVCIVGAGFMGLLTQRLVRAMGARETIVVARSVRREKAARRGDCDVFLACDRDSSAIAEVGASIVFDVTGDPAALSVATTACAAGAKIVLLGSPRGADVFPVEEFQFKSLQLVGANAALVDRESRIQGVDVLRRDAETYMSSLRSHEVVVDDLVLTSVDPREANRFYRSLASDSSLVGAYFDWSAPAVD